MENERQAVTHLFQTEFAKMVAVISKLFGLEHIEIAEDVVSDTFLQATESWKKNGLPENPAAWLYLVAKQKTLQQFRRNKIFAEKVLPEITQTSTISTIPDLDFSDQHIKDSQLQMLFAICNPAIASEARIGLALRILCGFGIDQIAEAFLTNKETINKRLFRAKEKLRSAGIKMEMPSASEVNQRLDNVLHIIYLLFNEGYYSTTKPQLLRKEFCLEALRVGLLLTEFTLTDQPKTNALIALMCFHASRFEARQSGKDEFILYDEQNEGLWDQELIARGMYHLEKSAADNEASSYHLEAGIAFWHCEKQETPEKWERILKLYNLLLFVNYSPSVALNRTYALYKARGKQAALTEALKLKLIANHFYFVLLGELHTGIDNGQARQSFLQALALAKTATDRLIIQQKIDLL